MQTALVFLAIAALAAASPTEVRVAKDLVPEIKNSVVDDLQDFRELIDETALLNSVFDSLNDPDVQNLLFFAFSPDFGNILYSLEKIPEHAEIVKIFEGIGFPIIRWINTVREFLGHQPFVPRQGSKVLVNRSGVNGLLIAIESALDYPAAQALHQSKIETSESFRLLLSTVSSDELLTAVNGFINNPAAVESQAILTGYGISFSDVFRLVKIFYGFPGQ